MVQVLTGAGWRPGNIAKNALIYFDFESDEYWGFFNLVRFV